jgi:hypothetical protein
MSKAEFTRCDFHGDILFNRVEFKEPDKVFLLTADFSDWSFINTDEYFFPKTQILDQDHTNLDIKRTTREG